MPNTLCCKPIGGRARPEWETRDHARDASPMLRKKLIVLVHVNSEEAGMAWFTDWLRPHLPAGIPLHHLTVGDPFRFI